jgi:hypothetical protein
MEDKVFLIVPVCYAEIEDCVDQGGKEVAQGGPGDNVQFHRYGEVLDCE